MKTDLSERLAKLGLHGVAKSFPAFAEAHEVLERLVACEIQERQERSVQRRLAEAKLGHFHSMTQFDWKWPRKIQRSIVEDALELRFMEDKGSLILIGPNGVGKTMIAKNIALRAVLVGKSVLFINAGTLLNVLSRFEDSRQLERKLRQLERYDLVVLDELGYLAYGARHADLLFQFIERRHEKRSLIITTNKTFSEWNTIFPSAACVSAIVDRLVQYGDIIPIEADSYRLHQGMERQKKKQSGKESSRPTR